jgi:cytochrome c oxidase subunit 1
MTPDNTLLSPERYNQIFTMHGLTMIFLFGMPMLAGLANYLVPLMIGARDMIFPRLNALGYWLFLAGGLFLYSSFLFGGAVDTGWFSYAPLTEKPFAATNGVTFWTIAIAVLGASSLAGAVNLIVTMIKLRTPGMTLLRMPLFAITTFINQFLILFAIPSLTAAVLMLYFDRMHGTVFFKAAQGGDPLLWQHLFWFFGHPEVYIMFIPGLGFVSSIVETFTGRKIFGYPVMVISLIMTGFVAFGLWVHHMFATPIPQLGRTLFTAASVLIAVPTGTQIFCWIATIWSGRPRYTTAMLFALGFIVVFTIGGLTGVMIASVPFDLQVHDTYFIVAHFHYVIIGGVLFPLFGACYYWFPKITGRLLSETLGKWQFWLFFVGVNVTFFPMHLLGLDGMPRRVYTYLPEMGWGRLNLLATFGSWIIATSVIVFVVNVARSWRNGAVAGPNPWQAPGLEWATTSPPPAWNFHPVPVVQGRAPLWESGEEMPVATGLATDRREVLVTTALDAEPDNRHEHPGESHWPLVMAIAVGVTFIGAVFTPWAYVVGFAFSAVAFAGWGWPRGTKPEDEIAPGRLPDTRRAR